MMIKLNKKRKLLFVILLILWFSDSVLAERPGTWEYYKKNFISKDGRVIDYSMNQSSHSEGQGYGLLLSVFFNDQIEFDRILNWTKNNIMIRHDDLFAWIWGKRITGGWGVVDYNNATDGDILIAWALIKASEKWKRKKLLNHGKKIIRSIKKHLVVNRKGQLFLIPGYYGFKISKNLVLNPSYFVYPAFDLFARAEDKKFWKEIYAHCLDITYQGLYTRLSLPADWIKVDNVGLVSIYRNKSNYFGYEAIRIPLYMAMSETPSAIALFSKYLDLYEKLGYLPDVVNLSRNQISLNEAPAGFYTVFSLVARSLGRKEISSRLMKIAERKIKSEDLNYYSHTLYLLSRKVMNQ